MSKGSKGYAPFEKVMRETEIWELDPDAHYWTPGVFPPDVDRARHKPWPEEMCDDMILRKALVALPKDKDAGYAIVQDVEQRIRKRFIEVNKLVKLKGKRKKVTPPGMVKKIAAVSHKVSASMVGNRPIKGPQDAIDVAQAIMVDGLTRQSPLIVAAAVHIPTAQVERMQEGEKCK